MRASSVARSWEEIPAEEGKPVDLVLQGGGVKGIGLVGAISVLEEERYRFQSIAGTSAGAIVATLIAAGYTSDELREKMMELDFQTEFMDRDPLDRIPGVGAALSILLEKGIFEGQKLKEWMSDMLSCKLGEQARVSDSPTFDELPRPQSSNPRFEHRVQVVTSDITARELLVLPQQADRLGVGAGNLEVATAIRMSTSIPIFFEPVWFPEDVADEDRHLLVDGGVLSNFPVWLFDVEPGQEPRWPTFGLRLCESPNKPLADQLSAPQQGSGDGSSTIVDYLKDLAATMMAAHDRLALERADNVRTIDIDALGIGSTQFDLSDEEKDDLYKSGRRAARAFLNDFDYEEHLRIRRQDGRL